MFPSIGSVDIADAETDLSHCAAFSGEAKGACEDAARGHDAPVCDAFSGPALAACVDAAHGSAPAPFDDGLMGAPAMGVPGMQFGNSTYDGSIKPRVHLDTSTRHKHGIFDLQPFPAVKTM